MRKDFSVNPQILTRSVRVFFGLINGHSWKERREDMEEIAWAGIKPKALC